jgi:acetoacetyl-CoA synthetase
MTAPTDTTSDTPLWRPDPARVQDTNMYRFMSFAEERFGVPAENYQDLWEFSTEDRAAFWDLFRRFANLKAETWGKQVLVSGDKMPGAKWFPDARLNYAENLLVKWDDDDALVFQGEDKVYSRVSWADMYATVSRLAQALRSSGVGIGDRVGGYLPNMPVAIMAMLATSRPVRSDRTQDSVHRGWLFL